MHSPHKPLIPKRIWIIAIALLIVLTLSFSAQAQDLVLRIGNVIAPFESEGIPIPVYMENYSDTVAALQFWMILDQPDIFEFQYGSTKSNPVTFDTSQTLISGWELVSVNTIGGSGYDARIYAQSSLTPVPLSGGIGYPQYGEIPLIKVLADIYDIPLIPTPLTVNINVQTSSVEHLGFADEMGEPIGMIIDAAIDTTCWNCLQWAEPPDDTICLQWELIEETIGDSCTYDTVITGSLDTNLTKIYDGSLTAFLCGDVNGDLEINIFDVVALIGPIYQYLPPPDFWEVIGDINGDGAHNIFDITGLISYIYLEGAPPSCNYMWLDE